MCEDKRGEKKRIRKFSSTFATRENGGITIFMVLYKLCNCSSCLFLLSCHLLPLGPMEEPKKPLVCRHSISDLLDIDKCVILNHWCNK